MKTYTPICGESIEDCIEEALKLSEKHSDFVEFTFNGITMEVLHPSNKTHYLKVWKQLCKKRSDEYNNSEEAKQAEINRNLELKSKQEQLDTLVEELTEYINNEDLLVWIKKLTELADHVGVKYDSALVLRKLDLLGFEDNMWVGYKGEWDGAHMLEYVVGQVINCIKSFGSPHPMTIGWCDKILDGNYK